MKLRLSIIVLFLTFPPHRGELLPPSLPNSVRNCKKTSLTGWLPLPLAQQDSPPGSLSSRRPTFPPASLPSVDYSNSK